MQKVKILSSIAVICLLLLSACGGGSETEDKAETESAEISTPVAELLIGEWDGHNKDGIPGNMVFDEDGRFALSQEDRTINGIYEIAEFDDYIAVELIPDQVDQAITTTLEIISNNNIKLMAMGDTITFNRIQ